MSITETTNTVRSIGLMMAGMLYERAARVELSSNLFGICPRLSEQNALIRKPLYKRYFLMRKLSKIVQHTLENSKCIPIQQENENVCDTHRAYGSSIWVGYAASSKSSGHPADSTGVSCLRDTTQS